MIPAMVKMIPEFCWKNEPNGLRTHAKTRATGRAINAPMIPPEIIFRNAICGIPKRLRKFACSIIGVAIVSPGTPISAVGIAWVKCFAMTAAMKNANTATGGAPNSTTIKVMGTMTAVSSVPEMSPRREKTTPATTAKTRAMMNSPMLQSPFLGKNISYIPCSFISFMMAGLSLIALRSWSRSSW